MEKKLKDSPLTSTEAWPHAGSFPIGKIEQLSTDKVRIDTGEVAFDWIYNGYNWSSSKVQVAETTKDEIPYKYSEDKLLEEIKTYIDKTYNEHYAVSGSGIQTTEFIIDNGHGVGFTVGNVMKYAQRYGKKEGRNRKDILKVIHYAIMLLHIHDKETSNEKA